MKLSKGALSDIYQRKKSESSIEETPCFEALLGEVWDKRGYTIVFIDEGVLPKDLNVLGIYDLGIINIDRRYIPARHYEELFEDLRDKTPQPYFPTFKGESVFIKDDEAANILKDYYIRKRPDLRVLCTDKSVRLFSGEKPFPEHQQIWLTEDNRSNRGALSILFQTRYRGDNIYGGILLLPSFKEQSIDIAIELINDYISYQNPGLFSEKKYKWLDDHKPYTVKKIEEQRDNFINEAVKKVEEYKVQIEDEHQKQKWMDQLLVGKGDDFTEAVAQAFEFLGFRITRMDTETGNRKREDLRINDIEDLFFALIEAKTTERGANESMIADIQNHQARYSREQNRAIPHGLLVINHSINIDPSLRNNFYKAQDIEERLIDNSITAIDSVFLHILCQNVFSGKMAIAEVKKIIESTPGILKKC